MCKGSNSTTTVQQPEIPEWLEGAFQGVIAKAGQVANTPFNPATMKNVASFSGDQNAAFDMANNMVGNWQPHLDTAAGFAQTAGSTIDPSSINQYMNPFQSQVIDATMANIQQNNALQQQQLQGNAALQGALGGDRVKVAQAELARQQNLASNQTLSNLNAQNYNQALGAAQADRTAAGNAATQFGSLANQISALGAGDYSRLLAQGGLQQGLAQQMLDTSSANAAMQAQFPFNITGWEQGIYTGASPTFTGYTSTQTQPSPSPLNSILGLGAMGLGAFLSDERMKEDIEPVGKLFDGTTVYKYRMVGDPRAQIGVMAQEVEHRTPEAVHEVGGVKLVNYDRATEKSEGLAARPRFADGGGVSERQLLGSVSFGGRRGSQSQPSGVSYVPKSYVPALSQTLGATQAPALAKPPPPPKQRNEDQDDPVKMFNEARKAAQGMNAGLGQIIGKLDTTSGPGGWSTSVQPTMTGLGNYLGNMMGRAHGGRVGYKKGGEVELPEVNPWDMYRRMFGTVPGWIAQGLGAPPSGVPIGDNASGVSAALQGGLLPAGAAFNQLGGGFGAFVDTDSLLSGGGTQSPGFSHVASGVMPEPPPAPPPPPAPIIDDEHHAYGGRVGYQQGGPVDPRQMSPQMPPQMAQGAPQAGLAGQPGMMPQGMPMAAPAAPMGLGMPMGGMMPGAMPPGMPGPMPMGGAPGGPMPALPPPGGMQLPMPPPGQPQGGLSQPIRIPPRSAPYGRKVLEKQMAREKGLGSRQGFQEGGVVDGYYDPEEDIWKVPQNVSETPGSGIGTDASTPSSPGMFENARSGKYSWLAEPLMAAGASMMASESPFVGPAIGKGALAGIKQYREAQKADALAREAKEKMDLERARLAETQRMNKLRAEEAELRLGEMRDPNLPYERRAAVIEQYGIDPESAEGRSFILTGELPRRSSGQTLIDKMKEREVVAVGLGLKPGTPAFQRYVATGQLGSNDLSVKADSQEEITRNLAGGIQHLARIPEEYGGDRGSFGSAVGSIRGDDESWLSPLARVWGSFTSIPTHGSPTEIRSLIQGGTDTLAATIKPLIRKPGEGAWSDRDQMMLNNIVGDLKTANNVGEYKRRLEGVRQRIMANFGVQLPPIDWAGGAKPDGSLSSTTPAAGTVEDGYRFKGGDPSDSANWEKVD